MSPKPTGQVLKETLKPTSENFPGIKNALVVALTIASVGLSLYTGLHPQGMSPFLSHGAYYAMLTLLLAWIYALIRHLQARSFSVSDFWNRYYPGLIFCSLLTLLIVISVKPSFKTLG